MDAFLGLARRAFRQLYGLPEEDVPSLRPHEMATIFPQARAHRILGLLEAGLAISSSDPDGLGSNWKTAVFGQARHTALYTDEAERLYSAGAGEIPSLTLIKGPALARQAWPDPSLRSFDDLDFRCRADELGSVRSWMHRTGYQPEHADERVQTLLWRYGWGISFRHRDGITTEINHRLFPPQLPWPLLLEPVGGTISHRMVLDHGSPVQTISGAGHLLLSCAHAAWHGWERLGWCVDFAGLLARHPGIFAEALELASDHGFARRSLLAGCTLVAHLFGKELCPDELSSGHKDLLNEAITLLTRSDRGITMAEQRSVHRRLLGSIQRWTYEWRRLSTPGLRDFESVRLDARMAGIYWLIRPFRAAGSLATGRIS